MYKKSVAIVREINNALTWTISSLLILFLSCYSTQASSIHNRERPNLLLITIDALRADHLSCYGYTKMETKSLDRIASKGWVFENALSQSPWTSPSIASLMTALYPSVHGVKKGFGLEPAFVTLAEVLNRAGFRTHSIVTTPYLSEKIGIDQGFQGYEVLGESRISKYFLSKDSADVVTDKAIRWLRRIGKSPFFLWIHYIDPHIPYGFPSGTVLPPYYKGYKGRLGNYFYDVAAVRNGGLRLDREDREHIKALYDADILFTDQNVGLLIDELERLDLHRNTMIVLTSDHGEELWDHGGFEHGHSLYQEVIRIPLILVIPGMKGGNRRIYSKVRSIDIGPTVLDVMGLKWGATIQGSSLIDLMTKGKDPLDRISFSESLLYGNEKKAIRKGKYTLIYEPSNGKVELYDTQGDHEERLDIAVYRKDIVEMLISEMDKWSMECQRLFREILKGKPSRKKMDLKGQERRLRDLGYMD